jgi:exodeoxyribonuclease-3
MKELLMLKLASWNINSLTVRLDQVLDWLESANIDVLALQETKIINERFPASAFIERGYHLAYSGQKTYNGVALISRFPISDTLMDLPSLDDPQRRILVATIAGIRVVNLYVPNGAAVDTDKYHYKLDWLTKVHAFIASELKNHPKLTVLGDFNIAPEDRDVHDPIAWQGCVLVSPAERAAFQQLLALGLEDSFRRFTTEEKHYSWWDYRAGSFRRNRGLRIDHILLSQELANLCHFATIDKVPRQAQRPSDHTPVWVELAL